MKGFTLLEVVVVVAIIAIVSLIGVNNFVSFQKDAVLDQTADEFVSLIESARTKSISGELLEGETTAEFKEITVDEAYQIFTGDKDYLFIDVRSEDEYNSGHIEGAIHIPVSEIESRLNEIPKDKLVIVYCNGSSCSRSSTAADILIENGFDQVYNIGGDGIFEWIEKGYPVTEL